MRQKARPDRSRPGGSSTSSSSPSSASPVLRCVRSVRASDSPTQGQRGSEETRGCPSAPHFLLDESVIILDDTVLEISQDVFEEVTEGRPVPTFLAEPPEIQEIWRGRRVYSDEALAAHQDAVNRALGIEGEQLPPSEEVIEMEDTLSESVIHIDDEPEEEEEYSLNITWDSSDDRSNIDEETTNIPVSLASDLASAPTSVPSSPAPATPSLNQTIDLSDTPELSPASASSSQQSPTLQCPVCLDPYTAIRGRGDSLVSTLCGHVFCQNCLSVCLSLSDLCPTCRTFLSPRDFHPLYF